MKPVDIGDILEKLLDLRTYSPEIAQRMEHEKELPYDAVPFLIDRIEASYAACVNVSTPDEAKVFSELSAWLIISYEFYLIRVTRSKNPWMFTYPAPDSDIQH
jgi:hypothetical protein